MYPYYSMAPNQIMANFWIDRNITLEIVEARRRFYQLIKDIKNSSKIVAGH